MLSDLRLLSHPSISSLLGLLKPSAPVRICCGKMTVVALRVLRALRALRRYRIGFDRNSYYILSSPIEGVSPNPI